MIAHHVSALLMRAARCQLRMNRAAELAQRTGQDPERTYQFWLGGRTALIAAAHALSPEHLTVNLQAHVDQLVASFADQPLDDALELLRTAEGHALEQLGVGARATTPDTRGWPSHESLSPERDPERDMIHDHVGGGARGGNRRHSHAGGLEAHVHPPVRATKEHRHGPDSSTL